MDYMRTMCDFYLTETEKPFPDIMKRMVLGNLKDCKNGGDRCNGFNNQKLIVTNADTFCSQVEEVEKGG